LISYKPGSKSPNDKIVFVNGHQILFKELAEAIVQFYKNEEEQYPTSLGFAGGEYLINFIRECCKKGHVSEIILKKYGL